MNDLLVLVKLLSALYQAKRIKDKNLISELVDQLNELPAPNPDVFTQDKEARDAIRSTFNWLVKQDDSDQVVIKSMLQQRVALFCKNNEELKEAIEGGMEDFETEDQTRKIIFQHIREVQINAEGEEFAKVWKKAVNKIFYKDIHEVEKDEWVQLADLVMQRVNQTSEERQSEIVDTITSDTPDRIKAIIQMAKIESSQEGVIKTPFQGLNEGLAPDFGMRRAKMYLINALTNRGKSLTLGHLLAGVGLYNKPLLRNKAKIPTALLESAEDTLDLIIMRMYKLAWGAMREGDPDFMNATEEDIIEMIVQCFKKNGWHLIINQIDSSKDTYHTMTQRVRMLENRGHEIIFWAYDYCGLQNIDGIPGDSKSDKLQIHFRKVRAFIIARGICFVTPHQLSPEAKRKLQETDEDSEILFAREVAGKSMTETSTKITNEVDVEITIHVAKTSFRSYWVFCIGKQRGEGCPPDKRYGFYDIHPTQGLIHDFGKKPRVRRSLTKKLNELGQEVNGFEFEEAA